MLDTMFNLRINHAWADRSKTAYKKRITLEKVSRTGKIQTGATITAAATKTKAPVSRPLLTVRKVLGVPITTRGDGHSRDRLGLFLLVCHGHRETR